MGRHKIAIVKIENKEQLHICFSKRRQGLFKKANELCRRGYKAAVIVFSPVGNAFVYAHHNVDAVIQRFMSGDPNPNPLPLAGAEAEEGEVREHEYRKEEAAAEVKGKELMVIDGGDSNVKETTRNDVHEGNAIAPVIDNILESERYWWNKPVDDVEPEELVKMVAAMRELRNNVKEHADHLLGEAPLSLWPYTV